MPDSPPFWAGDLLRRIAFMTYHLLAGNLPGANLKTISGLLVFSLYAVVGGLISLLRRRDHRPALLYSVLLLLVPILFVMGLAAVMNQIALISVPRFILVALPGFGLVIGMVVAESRRRVTAFLLLLLTIAISIQFQVRWRRVNESPTPFPYAEWAYGNLSSSVVAVNRQAKPGEAIIFDDPLLAPTWNVYQKAPLAQLLMSRKAYFIQPAMDFDERWQEVERKYSGIHFVRRAGGPPSKVVERLESRYRLVGSEQIGRMEIRHYIR